MPWALRAWSNFEFVDSSGKFYEVDLLLLTVQGLFLIEIKSYPGMVLVDDLTFVRKDQGPTVVEDNPLRGANLKCKVLKSVLQRQPVARDRRQMLPYIQAMVFLSHPEVDVRFREGSTQPVFHRENILPRLQLAPNGAPLDPLQEQLVLKAMTQAGISSRKKTTVQVNDWVLTCLLGEGPDYQDHLARHQNLDAMYRRVRTFSCSPQNAAERKRARAAAQREFRMLELIEHEGIIKPLEYKEHDLGPALLYRYDENAVRLDHFLQKSERARQLDRGSKLRMLRQLAEVLRYAHARHLIHRALAPQNILVSQIDKPQPLLRVMNWHTGRSEEETTGTVHLSALVADEMTAYMAPETFETPQLADASCDLFSLGAVGYFLLTGQPPANNQLELVKKLGGLETGLSLSLVADGFPAELDQLIQNCTSPDVTQRPDTVEQFLLALDQIETLLKSEHDEENLIDPFSAAQGDRLSGSWRLVRKLGQGAVSAAFLVRHEESEELQVLKLPVNPDHNEKLESEAEVLQELDHPKIVRLKGKSWVGERFGLFLSHAGDNTLSDRLAREGALGLELLQRFGDDLLEMVEYLEDKGYSHRDLKPANLGVRGLGKDEVLHLVLFDFSLAREKSSQLRVGTPGYRDPFLKAPRQWDSAAERYSAAVTLYEMATGLLPEWGRSDPALVSKAELQLESHRFQPELRAGFESFFQRALHRELKQRFEGAESMRKAWNALFRVSAAGHPSQPKLVLPEQISAAMALHETTEDARLLQALDRLEIKTVGEFVALPRARFRLLRGLGSQTRKELLEHQVLLESRLQGEAPVEVRPGRESLDAICAQLQPESGWEQQFCRAYLGLEGEFWRSGAQAAEAAKRPPADNYKALPRLRKRWEKLEPVRSAGAELAEALQRLGGAAVPGELAEMLLASRGSLSNENSERNRQAQAVLRAAQEVEQMQSVPRYDLYRLGGGWLLAESPEVFSAVRRLAQVADEQMEQHSAPTRESLTQALRAELPPGVSERVSEARLLQLAQATAQKLCLSSRGEPYLRGLAAARALRLGSGALVGRSPIRPAEVAEVIRTRFPEAEALPQQVQSLQSMLAEAGLELEWDRKKDAFASRQSSLVSTPSVTLTSGHEVRPIPRDQLERKLAERYKDGGSLVLQVYARLLERSLERLQQLFPLQVISLEQRLAQQLQRTAREQEVDWQVVLEADAAGPAGPAWGNLLSLVELAVDELRSSLGQSAGHPGEGGLVLYRFGLLARYHQLHLLERLMGESDEGRIGACWLLASGSADDLPKVDQQALPLTSFGKPLLLPRSWLENAEQSPALAPVGGKKS